MLRDSDKALGNQQHTDIDKMTRSVSEPARRKQKPLETRCKTVQEFLSNIKKASVVIEDDLYDIPIMLVLDSKNHVSHMTPQRYIRLEDGSFYYLTITKNGWIYLYDLEMHDQLDDQIVWYGTHYTIGFSDKDPDIVKFHITRYFPNRKRIERFSSYCDFKLSDFVKDVRGNPDCYREARGDTREVTSRMVPTGQKLDHILNNVRDRNRSYIRDFFKFGLTWRAPLEVPENQNKRRKLPVADVPPASPQTPVEIQTNKESPESIIYKKDGKSYQVQTGARGGKFIVVRSKIVRINASTMELFIAP